MYLVPFMQMARQRAYWSPQRLRRVVWSIAGNLRGHIELLRIFSLPAFRSLVLVDPVFSFRHLSTEFLFRGLSANERTASILHHYRFLISRMPNRIHRQFGHWEILVLEHRKNGKGFAVTLGPPPKDALWEGESLLQLKVDGVPVYHLQFTIVPGWVLRTEQRDVVFVQRLQGVKGCFEEVSAATKAFGDVAPRLLLVTVLQGIATAWGIREMACISAKSQCASKRSNDERSSTLFRQAYDEFFLELGATRVSADFFSLPLPIVEKPIELIGNGHKARTRRKRAARHEIANRVCEAIREAA
jgi:uncharacterized protein VirK/YbjX